ncbi:MAG: hypothetical protein ABIQ02_14925 [Saprospiraceae bacterium]
MKGRIFILLFIVLSIDGFAQTFHVKPKVIQLKVDLQEIVYAYPRIGIGYESKFSKISLWGSVHFGWDGLAIQKNSPYYDDEFIYWGGKAGLKRTYYNGKGEFFLGVQLSMDYTKTGMTDDVYYDLKEKSALLYDKANYLRERVGLLVENGYEFYIGKRFSLELGYGIGIRRIQNWYKDIENPFSLNDVEPIQIRNKTLYKYVGTLWRPAAIASIKFGYTFSSRLYD